MFRFPFFFLIFLLPLSVGWEEQTAPEPVLPVLKEIETAGPYCGIYSLVACFDTFGIRPDVKTLLVPEYVGSFKGSSDAELVKATENHGLHAKTYGNLTWQELRSATTPMILHFRSTAADSKYNHWVAFLGVDGKLARIIDVPHPLTTISFAELMAKWDGTAIVISDKPLRDEIVRQSRLRYLGLIGFLMAAAFCLQYFFWNEKKEAFAAPTRLLRFKRGVTQTAVFLGVVFIAAVIYHAFSEIGFLKNPTAVAEVTRRYYSVDVPEIALAEMETNVAENSCLIFDARYPRAFHRGTIPGARNTAINSSLTERRELLADVDKNRRIVVFCQSAGCGYADEVAQFLKFNDYSNVVLYRGGFREWIGNDEEIVTPAPQ